MIIIVEDDPAVRRSLQLLLVAQGHEVRTYPSGEAVLAETQDQPADCFIADYRLADMDAIELLSRLRARGTTWPAVLITGLRTPELDEKALAAGFAAIFEKPLRLHTLTDVVARLTGLGPNGKEHDRP
ncbi:MAG TPA: response regulator [Sphingobium sp.]